jgi:Phasin protein
MSDQDTRADKPIPTAIPLFHPELLDMARTRIEGLIEIQKEMMRTFESINHDMLNRMKAEAELASEFIAKLSGVRSVPDATTAYKEWASREMELLADDGRHIMANGEKLMQASQRLFSKGTQTTAH